LVNDFLQAYSLGHKTAYYSNIYDGRSDGMEEEVVETKSNLNQLIEELTNLEGEDYCESCTV